MGTHNLRQPRPSAKMNLATFAHMRGVASEIFRRTLSEVNVHKVLANRLENTRGVLRICDDLYDLNRYSRVFVVSMGKAAHAMIETLAFVSGAIFTGVAVSGHPAETQVKSVRYFEAGHPLPSAESVRAI